MNVDVLNNVLDFLKENDTVAAYLGLLGAFVNFVWMLFLEHKNKFNIKVECSDPYIFPALDTRRGNRNSLTFNIRITNFSAMPVNITKIELVQKGLRETCVTENLNYTTKTRDGEGEIKIAFNRNMVLPPHYLEPFDEVSGRVLFVCAGGYPERINKIKIRIVTSRGTKTATFKAPSYEYSQTFFR